MTTSIYDKIAILGDIWMKYRTNESFQQFTTVYDIGCAGSFILYHDLLDMPDEGSEMFGYIDEAWNALVGWLELPEGDYKSIEDVFAKSPHVTMQ